MPGPDEILAGLTVIANRWLPVAVLWHVLLALALAGVASGVLRPSNRLSNRIAASAAAAPLASVSLFAWLEGNPFNGTVLALGALALVSAGARSRRGPLATGPRWALVLGALAIAFGWVYPHFLVERPAWLYLVAAPLGLVPCPSLAVVLGLGLCAGAFGSRTWAAIAGSLGLFYGVFGALRLGVWLDLPLVAAALGMLALARHDAAGPARA